MISGRVSASTVRGSMSLPGGNCMSSRVSTASDTIVDLSIGGVETWHGVLPMPYGAAAAGMYRI